MGSAPFTPVLIYDGACDFCRFWLNRWRSRLGDRIEYLAFQDSQVAERFPHLSATRLKSTVHFVDSHGAVSAGAAAVFEIISLGGTQLPIRAYRGVPGVAWLSELAYRLVAGHRPVFWKLTKLFFRAGR
jgi:predicted DCC family thiol-disulfide oxidoreductase YuxK